LRAPVEAHRDQPGQHRGDEDGHEHLVCDRLILLQHRPQTFGEQRRIDPVEPPAAKRAEQDACREEQPGRGPAQSPGGGEQQRAHRDGRDRILQQ
jgi:hypothetical protein